MNSECDQLIESFIIRHKLLVCYIGIFLGLIMFYGVKGEHDEFFEQGNGVNAEYQVLYAGDYFHLGEMVSHWAIISILTILGIVFVIMGNAFAEDYLEKKRNE